MRDGSDIRYARSGEYHIAYEVSGPGGGVDVLRIAAFVSNLEVLSPATRDVRHARPAGVARAR